MRASPSFGAQTIFGKQSARVNAICLPSGDQLGSSLASGSWMGVSSFTSDPSGRVVASSHKKQPWHFLGPYTPSSNAIFVPSGDQAGLLSPAGGCLRPGTIAEAEQLGGQD